MEFAIIAAGQGSRLASEGIGCYKPLAKVGGVPLVNRLVGIFVEMGATALHIIVNEEMDGLPEYIHGMRIRVPLYITVKSTPSSLHSLYELIRNIASPTFCLTTVDTVFSKEEFGRYLHDFRGMSADALMGVTPFIDDESPLYVNVTADNTVTSFTDKPLPESRYVSGGVYGLRTASVLPILFNAVDSGQCRMRNFQRSMISAGLNVKAWPFGKIIDVDHAADIAVAESFLKSAGG
jgi:NDP-sugar pyrophosphorylase family protein